jgi:F420-0:gamma-glutamyl ligase-like protein
VEYGDPQVIGVNMNVMFKTDDTAFYGTQLFDVEHVNYIGIPEEGMDVSPGPVIVSLELKTKQKQDKLRCIVRTREEFKRVMLPLESFPKCLLRFCPEMINIRWEKIKSPEFAKELKDIEERFIFHSYKFGVLYSKNVKCENDLFAVTEEETSKDYKEFLEFLGERITLEGWQGYRGGLDVKTNTTGTHSVFTKMENYEIMFHVATLLPSQAADEQRVERKRHIGNDVVVIVFHEGEEPFDVTTFTSQFIRVVFVIKKIKTENGKFKYGLVVGNRRGVSSHTPVLPYPPIFDPDVTFRNFLLLKCINAERTALKAADIRIKMARTNAQFISHLVNDYLLKDKKKK